MFSYQEMEEDAHGAEGIVIQKCCSLRDSIVAHGLKIILLISIIVIVGLSIGISTSSRSQDSCPELTAEHLLTQVNSSYLGHQQVLTCRSGYKPFPEIVQCVKRGSYSLTWTHLPVCYPETAPIDHFQMIVCNGNESLTSCSMTCSNNYVPVDPQPYSCSSSPCPKMKLIRENKDLIPSCYICDQKCKEFHSVNKGGYLDEELLTILGCSSKCVNVILSSKKIPSVETVFLKGVYTFLGEHQGHPLYVNKATRFYLLYINDHEWIIGNTLNGTNMFFTAQTKGNDRLQCPMALNSDDVSTSYYEFISDSDQGWRNDSGIAFECSEEVQRDFSCPCSAYNVFHSSSVVPSEVKYLLGNYTLSIEKEKDLRILSQVYEERAQETFLISNSGHFRLWSINQPNGDSVAVGYALNDGPKLCPDDEGLTWHWYNTSTPEFHHIYVKDPNFKVKCIQKI